jgi:hypothetical protein
VGQRKGGILPSWISRPTLSGEILSYYFMLHHRN